MSSTDLEALARQVQRLTDIEALKRLKNAYFRCLDTANVEELKGLLTEDYACRCIGGDYEYKASGREEFLEMIANSFHSEMITQHNSHGPEIDILSDTEAKGLWYFHDQVYHFRSRELLIGTGLYYDRYVKVEGEWRIQYAEYERVYEITEVLPRAPHVTAHYLAEHGRKLPASAAYQPETGRYA
ncbi:MAG: nuclear transport factor 2 family protein [Deltaproteobacteria bacterium]|nr:nuclear transport factor 2 family protein [Deltaproteobacteria bacterium]MBW2420867.1 nuclear transport factor 2 family protein [Deltaproteobacteria bacterium]